MKSDATELEVVVIGAGFAGLGAAIRLKEEGIEAFVVLEAAAELGGTWRDNDYPGCACDVPSHLYSYSFRRKPDWSRTYGEQAEILDYLRRCADAYGLRPHLRFGREVASATFDDREGRWAIETRDGERFRARAVIAATGPLSKPAIPTLPGLAEFAGVAFHSARWRHDVDLSDKRVAVIGTGASAIQFVPAIAPKVGRLDLYQRTAPWVMPKRDRPFTAREQRRFARHPRWAALYRSGVYASMEARAIGFVQQPAVLRLLQKLGERHIAASVADPALRAKVTPDYVMGCKRILISNDYYPAITRPNVDVITDRIERVTPRGIVDAAGREREVDAIVFGTGFRVTDFVAPMKITGLGGRDLAAEWSDGAATYYGIASHGFPNFYTLVGPNTGLGHNSIVFMIESQLNYVIGCLRLLRRRRLAYVDVRADVQARFHRELQERLRKTVWASGCTSWYLDERGRNYTLWPGYTFEYWYRTRRVDERDFVLVELEQRGDRAPVARTPTVRGATGRGARHDIRAGLEHAATESTTAPDARMAR